MQVWSAPMAQIQPNASAGQAPPDPARPTERGHSSLGLWVIVMAGVLATAYLYVGRPLVTSILNNGPDPAHQLRMWTFAEAHARLYQQLMPDLNRGKPEEQTVYLQLLSSAAMTQRLMSGFSSNLPTADLIEYETSMAGKIFSGGQERVGLVDLRPRLEAEGWLRRLNGPSLSMWSLDDGIYGIPHDVHPVMLVYRDDLVREAGIDITQVTTWAEFERVMRPLVRDLDGDGKPDRYPMNLSWTDGPRIEALMLQAGGGVIGADGRPQLDHPWNAVVAARAAMWCVGPQPIAGQVPDFNQAGYELRRKGFVVADLLPDWYGGVLMQNVQSLAGKLKVMPLPAWEPGGRRVTVWGGSALGIAKQVDDLEAAWVFARDLYLRPETARRLYETNLIISPVKDHWDDPLYDEPVPFYSGQPVGRLMIELAEDVPPRAPSPFKAVADARLATAMFRLAEFVSDHPAAVRGASWTQDQLDAFRRDIVEPEAAKLLREAQAEAELVINRNRFAGSTGSVQDVSDLHGGGQSGATP